MRATLEPLVARSIESTIFLAARIDFAQPFVPILPLPSITSTISVFTTHLSGTGGHACMLQFFSWLRSSLVGQWPPPIAFSLITWVRLLCPPSHGLEQLDHTVQSARTQSLSHDCMLQLTTSSVSPHASPPSRAS